MRLVTRSEWGARRARNGHTRIESCRGVKVHYLGGAYSDREHSKCDDYVRSIQNQHMDGNGWADIGYNFAVCTHGHVFEGRGLHAQNAGNGNTTLNRQHYAVVALVGTGGVTEPTQDQVQGLKDVIRYCRDKGGAGREILGHRDGYATACPGPALYALVKSGALEPGKVPVPADANSGTHTVARGETLTAIARKYGTTVPKLVSLNGIRDKDSIRAGDTLKVPAKKTAAAPKYQPFPGADFFKAGRKSPIITAMGRRLVAEGCGKYRVGPGPEWSDADRASYAAWQRKLGYTGSAADGIPGKASWDKLKVPAQ